MKIFIGSTFEDLKEYRKRAIDALNKLAVKIEAMELWYSKPKDPLSVCIDIVKKSDVYLCLVAHRYGTTTDSGKSFTQLEYETAIGAGKDCLVFIMSESHPIPPIYVDKGKNSEKLENFKQILRNNHTIVKFSTPNDLAHKVIGSVRDLMKEKGISKALELNLNQFWGEIKNMWGNYSTPEIRPEIDINANIIELINQFEDRIDRMGKFEKDLRLSQERLENDLELIIKKIGGDPCKLEKIDYMDNPFSLRDEDILFYGIPNTLTDFRILVALIRVKYLEALSQTSEWNEELENLLKNARIELKKAIECGAYID